MENDDQILLKLPRGLKLAFQSCAENMDLTVSQILRKYIRDFVDKNYEGNDLFKSERKRK